MSEYVQTSGLQVSSPLFELVRDQVLPGLELSNDGLWKALADLAEEFAPRIQACLERRDELQRAIDAWHKEHRGGAHDAAAYEAFLREIGYLVPEGEDFSVQAQNVDPEIRAVPAPQLVAPLTNARYATNAANARWGSLFDALYGTNALPLQEGERLAGDYHPGRGARVMEWVAGFLDQAAPLDVGSHQDAVGYGLEVTPEGRRLVVQLRGGVTARLKDPEQLKGYQPGPSMILLQNHGLHIELHIDREHPVGRQHPASVKDVVLESAVTTIMDMEDSVAVVDGEDKALAMGNWLGLIKGHISSVFTKNGKTVRRALNGDRVYLAPDEFPFTLSGRSLLLLRITGLHMRTGAVLDSQGREIPESLLDALLGCVVCLHDVIRFRGNSKEGSIYIVVPKLHGPEEAALVCELFSRIEELLGLAPDTVKLGIMDEERRTTVNLKECLRPVAKRLIFINTGFLDRTGDEIHTDMEAGALVRKNDMRAQPWMTAYEDWNVDVGLACGLSGAGQIGKGMWAKPDEMHEMLQTKAAHPQAGASCAWVPSPTAATLHATHYHAVDVFARQRELAGQRRARLADLLTLPLLGDRPEPQDVQQELENNCQSILGYVARWVGQGVGCSKVPDIHNVGLMEDRATLRISSQHIANWLYHGVVGEEQAHKALEGMAVVVDEQNAADAAHAPLSRDFAASQAFQAARELVFQGREQPNGYTEFILHRWRRKAKSRS